MISYERTGSQSSGCGCALLVLAFNIALGGFATQYVVNFWAPYLTHHAANAPFWPCAIAGLFLGEVTIPAVVVTWLLSFVI